MKEEKEKEVHLSDIDASFIISSFKNKERRNNPSSIPRPLLPPREQEKEKENELSNTSNELGNVDICNLVDKSDIVNSNAISGIGSTSDELTASKIKTKRTTSRQLKVSFEEYQKLFLTTPKIKHRKPVFISEELRERLDEIARKIGYKGMSASGFIENMAIHHLKMYEEDIEYWRKL